MADIINIDDIVAQKDREERRRIENALQDVIESVRKGELVGVLFVGIPTHRESLSIGVLKKQGCGFHEMIGASTMLNDYLRDASKEL